MSRVILHAGMPKTGSSSIQNWMRDTWPRLAEAGVTIVHDGDAARPGEITPFRSGLNVASNQFLLNYIAELQGDADPGRRAKLVDEFLGSARRVADEVGDIVMSCESYSSLFIADDEFFMAGLDRLGAEHEVELAYYVRPQDSAIEARWRAWGYKNRMEPSEWILGQLADLDYWATVETIRGSAPGVRVSVRPFQPAMLEGHDAVVDFAVRVLGVEGPEAEARDYRDNVGVPLDLVNLLRDAPETLWSTPITRPGGIETGLRQVAISRLGRDLGIEESDEARQSRLHLQRYAAQTFADGNARLASEFGWGPGFLADGVDLSEPADLATLDELWTPVASATTKQYLYAALDRLLDPPVDS